MKLSLLQKMALGLVLKAIDSVDWNVILTKILVKASQVVKEKTGVDIDLAEHSKEILTAAEKVVETEFGISLDLDDDGK